MDGLVSDLSYEDLEEEVRSRIPSHSPDWTDHNDADPGISLLELFAFLASTLVYFGAVGRFLRSAGVIDRVGSVEVDGQRWREVDNLADSGPDDRHYELDPERGEVLFGDGLHGKRPPSGSAQIRSSYRFGGGAVLAVGAAAVVWVGAWFLWCRLLGRRAS